MSQDFLDPELLNDFIIESKEHLETIEPNLLELEKDPANVDLLNEIFRPMHSLKGASGFLALNRINQLAHKSENILDELRKGAMVVTPEIMDVILASTDALRHMLVNLEASSSEGDVPIEHIIAQIDALLQGEGVSSPLIAPSDLPVTFSGNTLVAEPTAKPLMSVREWIASLDRKAQVSLTAFGEDHLKDFVDEARENTSSLTAGLLELERSSGNSELVNDLFRFFHNVKGNSGIIGYCDLNELTHEAETLLNQARQGDISITPDLVDLLLVVVDAMDVLVDGIDFVTATATPIDCDELLAQLQKAVAGESIALPAGLHVNGAQAERPVAEPEPDFSIPVEAAGANRDADDLEMFAVAAEQQKMIMQEALTLLKEDGERKDQQDALYRGLTSVQHASAFMGFNDISLQAERTAGLVAQARKSELDFGLILDLLRQEISILNDLVADTMATETSQAISPLSAPQVQPQENIPVPEPALSPPSTAEASAEPSAAKAEASPTKGNIKGAELNKTVSSSIRVDHERLDHLMNLIGELLINRNRYSMLAKSLENAGDDLDLSEVALALSETTYAMTRVSDELQDTIMKVRMMPVSSVFSRFPRLVRDLSRKSGKEVELILEGEDTELDKSIVEVINDPLMHLIRNAVDHGIESKEERVAAGKSPGGRVHLRAYHKGNSVVIEIEDDGRGIDPEKMREVAVRKGIISFEDARNLDDREAIDLIFSPGFSSASAITDISGRGVGMDVVRTNIKNLKGSVSTTATLGQGTKFTLLLPLTLAIIEALMIRMGDQMYAIPLDAVSTTTKLESARLTNVKGRKAVTMRGEVLGIMELGELLNLKNRNPELPEVMSVVILQDNDRHLGLVVDQLLDRQEIVIKSLGTYLSDVRGLSGASIMGDGSVVLILDPHEIYLMATSKAL